MQKEYTRAKYDRFEDATMVATAMVEVQPTADPNGRLLIAFRCDLAGERVAPFLRGANYRPTDDLMASLAAYAGRSTRYDRVYLLAIFIGGEPFSRDETLYFLTDEYHRIRLDAKQAISNPIGIDSQPTQTLVYEISETDLRDLVSAHSVDGRLGSIEFKVSSAELAALAGIGRDLLG